MGVTAFARSPGNFRLSVRLTSSRRLLFFDAGGTAHLPPVILVLRATNHAKLIVGAALFSARPRELVRACPNYPTEDLAVHGRHHVADWAKITVTNVPISIPSVQSTFDSQLAIRGSSQAIRGS